MTLVKEAVAAFLTTTNKARSLDKVVQDNIVFLLMNIRDAVSTDVMENQLYELEGTHQVLMGKASASYLKKLGAFNSTLATYIHNENNKEKKEIATPQPQPQEETVTTTKPKWGFIPLLQHLGLKGTIPKSVLANVRSRQWIGGRQFVNTKNGGAKWSELLAQVATAMNKGKRFTGRLLKTGGLNYGIKIVLKPKVVVSCSRNSGYDISKLDSRGGYTNVAHRNDKAAANTLAAHFAAKHNLEVRHMS